MTSTCCSLARPLSARRFRDFGNVVAQPKAPRPTPEGESSAGPQRRIAPVLVQVPAPATGSPHRPKLPPLQLVVERALDFRADVDGKETSRAHLPEGAHDVPYLRFD